MRPLLILFWLAFVSLVSAQTPAAWLKFDGDLTDASNAGLITSVSPNAGFAPVYAADRFGVDGKAIEFPNAGGASLQLESALTGNSNQSLGLRNAAGTNTSFTLAAWVYVNSISGQGYNTVFGNIGTTEEGTLHAGLNTGSDKTHLGFQGNDLNGGAASLAAGQWYHLAFVYDASGTAQRIYVNGLPDATRTGVTNTLKAADLLIGNWGSTTSTTNDFRGRLDDVVVYNSALKGDQILALFHGASPALVPALDTYFAPATTYGTRGTAGMWGVREIKAYPGIPYRSLVNVDRLLKAQAEVPGGTVADYWTSVINITDDESPGTLGYFGSEGDFATNTPAADDNILLLARSTIKITSAGHYTFGFSSDDGARLRVVGQPFLSSTRIATGNSANPAHVRDTLVHPNETGSSTTLGVMHLPVGEYDLEFSYWEGQGGCAVEVFAAPGSKTSVDSTFQLIGNTAAGGLEIVPDSGNSPKLTVNGVNVLAVQGGSPASMTLAWSVPNPGTTLSIDNGIGTVLQSGSITLATPLTTTTYTISAITGAETFTRSVTVYVDVAPPPILTLTAADTTVVPNANATLNWTSQGATTLTLDPGNIDVTGTTSRDIHPASTTTYTLTAANGTGSVSQSIIIATGPAPEISSFTVSDPSPVYGKETTLEWAVTGSSSQTINQLVGSVSMTGSARVVPLLTAVYTLSAANEFGITTADVLVTLPTPIGVSSAGFSARRVSATTAFPFQGQGYLESAVSLLAGLHAGATTIGGPYTTINFTDGTDGDFTSGNVSFPGGTGNNYAVQITGTLVVNTPGEYTFMVNSDDGCRLRIDGVDVIVDDATHSPSTSSGRIVLSKPSAQIELIYYDATGNGEVELSWVRPNLTWQQLSTALPATPAVLDRLVISEFCASNSNTLNDEDGAPSDWIEIWNSTNAPIDLAGYYLCASAATPNQWAFPSKILEPNEYLVVFASGKNRANPAATLHTTFTLPAGGGYLALNKDDGAGGFAVVSEFNPFPAQTQNITYGSSDSEGYVGFMQFASPGSPNAASYTGFVQPVTFGIPRGRYSSTINLGLATVTPAAEIRYTLDGSEPSWTNGTLYTGPLAISSTTVVRASAFISGWLPPVPTTSSYIFLDDIVTQSAAQAASRGWPQSSVNGQVFRYGMNLNAVTSGGGDLAGLKSALASAPSVCLNMNPEDFFGVSKGIFTNPSKRGRFWERAASLEIINPDGTSAVQKDCGIRIRGNYSRSSSNPKHAFHLYFRSLYAGDLIHPLFGAEGNVTRFDQIDMRCEQNYSWSFGNSNLNALMREEWARKTQGDQGQPYSRSSYFHLYINGIYWGIFNWQEKTEADYAANQFGGEDIDYDTVKSAGSSGGYNTEMTDGNIAAWQKLYNLCLALKSEPAQAGRTAILMQMMGLNPDGSRNVAYPILLDTDNLIDLMLIVFYNGSFDAPMSTFLNDASNNWFGIRKRDGTGGGFMFFAHDHEHGMGTGNQGYNRVGPWGGNGTNNWGQGQYGTRQSFAKFNPQYLHEFLCFSDEYRQLFSDRVQRNFFGPGALTTTASLTRLADLAAKVDPIIHAEAARWGSNSLNRNSWLSAKTGIENFVNLGGNSAAGQTSWTAQPRTSLVVEQLKGYTDEGAKPLFIEFGAPVFSGQAGGQVSPLHTFNITNPNPDGELYYTLDGSDPRAVGGGINSSAQTQPNPASITLTDSATVRARVYNSVTQVWSGITEQSYLIGVAGNASNLVLAKILYKPATGVTNGEFLEIMNIGPHNVLMANCKFTVGITYTFPANYVLAPGARCLIVESQSSFTAANPAIPAAMIAGQYSGGLSNSGERLLFIDATGATIKDFSYGIAAPWPTLANGTGPCLVLLKPEINPDHGVATNWRNSISNGGTPGVNDGLRFETYALTNGISDLTGQGDNDRDGVFDLMEYALGLDSTLRNSDGILYKTQLLEGLNYLTLTFSHPLGHDDARYQPEASTDLVNWENAVLVSSVSNGNDTETLVYRHTRPKNSDTMQYLRLTIIK